METNEQRRDRLPSQDQPTIAPGMNMSDELEGKASAEDVEKGDSTSVTRLYLDRTPKD